MRRSLPLAVLLALVPAASRAQLAGFFSRDCVNVVDLQAAGGELHAVRWHGTNDTPDNLFDARATGGAAEGADMAGSGFSVSANFRNGAGPLTTGAVVVTLPSEAVLYTTRFASVDVEARKPQVVGAIDGVRPGVQAVPFGYEISFRPLMQESQDEAVGCAVGGSVGNGRPVIGYNVYRLPGTGNPPLSQFRSAGFAGFVDVRRLRGASADGDGFGCADGAPQDETRLVNVNGILDDGDEVVVFRDTLRTHGGVLRATAPDPTQSYVYRVQPVLRGDPAYYGTAGATVGSNGLPATAHDRDGNGSKESVDLLADGSDEFADPGMRGLGLLWDGQLLSSLQPGQATPPASSPDPDGDGMTTALELGFGLDPAVSNASLDTDGDGPLDRLEAESGNHPALADTDGSGERDGREMFYGRSAVNVCDDIPLTGRPLGDVAPAGGGDGQVTIADAVRMLRLAVTIEFPTDADLVAGDIAPAELGNAGTNPPTWRRHGLPDGTGQHPFGRFEHGDKVIDVADAVLVLRQSVGLIAVTD